jgi:hypothetical protein
VSGEAASCNVHSPENFVASHLISTGGFAGADALPAKMKENHRNFIS